MSATSSNGEGDIKTNQDTSGNDKMNVVSDRLGRKLAYLLRYGAEKEGISVDEAGGWVPLDELLQTNMLRKHTAAQVLSEVTSSTSVRGRRRFEISECPTSPTKIRAAYGRCMERSPYHEGSKVKRLLAQGIETVANNVARYDLTEFTDDYLLNLVIRSLKRSGHCSTKALRTVIVPGLSHLDLSDTYVSEAVLKLIGVNCCRLKSLSLKGCSYACTDHSMPLLLKKLPELESLNLSGCNHLTEKSLLTISNKCPRLRHLNLTFVPKISVGALEKLLVACKRLEELNIYDYTGLRCAEAGRICQTMNGRKIRIHAAAGMVIGEGCLDADFDSAWERPNYR